MAAAAEEEQMELVVGENSLNENENNGVEEAVIDELEIEYNQLLEQQQQLDLTTASPLHEELVNNYLKILALSRNDENAVKIKEKVIYNLTKIYTVNSNYEHILNLLKQHQDFFSIIPKAKTAKIVRNILDIISTYPNTGSIQINLCREIIDWCKLEKRTFLRQRIESKLASLLLQDKHPQEALSIIYPLLRELKKLDDKQMLTEVHLLESHINHSLQNIPKAKAALTASRSNANSIYVTPLLQAELDEMSGTLCCEEKDNVTGFSYFLEAFEGYGTCKDIRAVRTLKYMCLCKILGGHANEVPSLLSGKHGMKYSGTHAGTLELEAMAAVARAAKKRSLEEFEATVEKYSTLLKSDDLISHHLDILYDQMLEGNLMKIIHPFSCVEIAHVAKLIKMDIVVVERKLSQMILDRTLTGILDQGKGHLIIYDQANEDKCYTKGVEIIQNMTTAVDALTKRAKSLATTKNTKTISTTLTTTTTTANTGSGSGSAGTASDSNNPSSSSKK